MRRISFNSILLLALLVGAVACGDFTNPAHVEVEVIGSSLSSDFSESGEISISTLARDKETGDVVNFEPSYEVELQSPEGIEVELEQVVRQPSSEQGQFSVLIDSSGSMDDNDPDDKRIEAAKTFIDELFRYGGGSEVAVYDWNCPCEDFSRTNTLHDFATESEADALKIAAEEIISDGGTPLFDSMMELLDHMDERAAGEPGGIGSGLIALTDGKDGDSVSSADEVIERAQELNIPIYIVGIGPASREHPDSELSAVREAEKLTGATGGVYTSVENIDTLQQFARNVAQGATQGFDTTTVSLDPIPSAGESINGTITATGANVFSSTSATFTLDVQ